MHSFPVEAFPAVTVTTTLAVMAYQELWLIRGDGEAMSGLAADSG